MAWSPGLESCSPLASDQVSQRDSVGVMEPLAAHDEVPGAGSGQEPVLDLRLTRAELNVTTPGRCARLCG